MKYEFKPKPYDKYLYLASAVLIVIILMMYADMQRRPAEPVCVLNGTEYWYWNNDTKQGFIVTEPETDCKLIMTDNEGKHYHCFVMFKMDEWFVITEPETDFKLAGTFRNRCIKWAGL